MPQGGRKTIKLNICYEPARILRSNLNLLQDVNYLDKSLTAKEAGFEMFQP